MIRAFIGIPLEAPEITGKILEIQKRLKSFSGIKTVEPENLHLTIKFLGNISSSQIKEIKALLSPVFSSLSPFEVSLKGIGAFPSENYIRVIWIGIEEPQTLERLMRKVDEKLSELGFEREKSYVPHLTIARVKRITSREKLVKVLREHSSENFGKMPVNRIVLFRSELFPSGPAYSRLHEWLL